MLYVSSRKEDKSPTRAEARAEPRGADLCGAGRLDPQGPARAAQDMPRRTRWYQQSLIGTALSGLKQAFIEVNQGNKPGKSCVARGRGRGLCKWTGEQGRTERCGGEWGGAGRAIRKLRALAIVGTQAEVLRGYRCPSSGSASSD